MGFHHRVFWITRAFFHHFLVVGLCWVSLVHSSVGGGTLESHYIEFLEVSDTVFNPLMKNAFSFFYLLGDLFQIAE